MNFDAIYLEFSKAFDKVDHVILVQKLQNIAIGGILLNWLKSFRSYWANSESLCEYFFSPMNQKLSVQYPKVKFLFYIIFYILYHQWRKCEALDSFFIHRWHKTEKYIATAAADIFFLQEDFDPVYEWTTQKKH